MSDGRVWLSTVATLALYGAAIAAADLWIVEPRMRRADLSLAVSFVAVQAMAIAVMLAFLMLRKDASARRAARSAELQHEVQQALAAESLGQDQLRHLRSLIGRSRRDVESGVASFLATVRGRSYDRMVAVAHELGLAVPADPDRLAAQFARAAGGTLLEQAAIIEELEPYAAQLAEQQIARAVTSSDLGRALVALDMLYAWRRVVPVAGLPALLAHADAQVRARAFRALPYAGMPDGGDWAKKGMGDADASVRALAAKAAARLGVADAVEPLSRNVADPNREAALAAAFALATLDGGRERLEAISNGTERTAAAAAFEALEKAALGRLEPA